jgi:DNA-directed RNA polymerase specialized sigma24 family protein
VSNQGTPVDERDVLGEFAAEVAAGTADIDPALAAAAMRALLLYLRHRFPGMNGDDLSEATHEAVARLAASARVGGVRGTRTGGRPGGYLLRTAENLIIDQLRSARWSREQPIPNTLLVDLVLTDDEAARTLDRRATTDMVRHVLSQIQAAGDATAFRVAAHMLDVIQRTGRVPSNRQTALACGVSHTTVADVLQKLRRYFPDQPRP